MYPTSNRIMRDSGIFPPERRNSLKKTADMEKIPYILVI